MAKTDISSDSSLSDANSGNQSVPQSDSDQRLEKEAFEYKKFLQNAYNTSDGQYNLSDYEEIVSDPISPSRANKRKISPRSTQNLNDSDSSEKYDGENAVSCEVESVGKDSNHVTEALPATQIGEEIYSMHKGDK